MPVVRDLPTAEAEALLELTRDLVEGEVLPKAAAMESAAEFPREVFRTLGKAGLLGLAYPEEYGGGGQPYEVYLQVLEERAGAWLSVGTGVSVRTLACHPVAVYGTPEQVYDKIMKIHQQTNNSAYVGVFSYAGMPHEEAARNVRQFAATVMPELKKFDAGAEIDRSQALPDLRFAAAAE